jgi:formylglycine-generating enzyme required for sulfatase activity
MNKAMNRFFLAMTFCLAIAAAAPDAFAQKDPQGDFTIADLNLAMVAIEPGSFLMGRQSGGLDDERPVTTVVITKPFWLGKTEVTQAQWAAVMERNPSRNKGGDLPVEMVTWDDAMAFCQKLTEREYAAGRLPAGYVYTLPSEAQWEYACRAGTTGDFAGNIAEMAWYDQNSGERTQPVATKQANAWGLYDMHGNVWEWTRSRYGDYPGGSVKDYEGPDSGSNRVYRGGAWMHDSGFCRASYRASGVPEVRSSFLGFRLALSVTRQE